MPSTSVIQIDVDDAQFKAFYDLFNKYAEKVSETNASWEQAQQTFKGAFGHASATAVNDLSNGMAKSVKHGNALARIGLGLNRSFGILRTTVRGVSTGLHLSVKAAERLSAVLAGVIAGYDKLSDAAINRTNAARAVNSTSGRVSAFQAAARATGLAPADLPASIIQGVTTQPGWTMLAGQAIGMTNQQMMHHTVEASERLMQLAHDYMKAHGHDNPAILANEPMVKSMIAAGLPLDRQILAGNTPERNLQQFFGFVRQNAKLFQLAPGAALAMAKFKLDLSKAGLLFETDLINKLKALGPSLGTTIDKLTSRLVDLLNKALTKRNIDAVKSALTDFDKFMSSGKFKTDLKEFEHAIGVVSKDLIKLAPEITGIIGVLAKWLLSTKSGPAPREGPGPRRLRPGNLNPVRADQLATFGINETALEQRYGLAPGTLAATAEVESQFTPNAMNGHAVGMFQEEPAFRKRFGGGSGFDAAQEAQAAARGLAHFRKVAEVLDPHASAFRREAEMIAAYHDGSMRALLMVAQKHRHTRGLSFLQDASKEGAQEAINVMSVLPDKQVLAMLQGASPAEQVQDLQQIGRMDLWPAVKQQDFMSGKIDRRTTSDGSTQHLRTIAANTSETNRRMAKGIPVSITLYTPVTARTANQLNGMQ